MGHSRPGEGVSADFAVGAGSPPRCFLDGKPELTEAPWLRATAAEEIPEGFRQATPGRVAPGGAEARSPSPARNKSGRDQNPLEILKSPLFKGGTDLSLFDHRLCVFNAHLDGREGSVQLGLVAGLEDSSHSRAGGKAKVQEVATHDERLGRSLLDLQSPGTSEQPLSGRKAVEHPGRTTHLIATSNSDEPINAAGMASESADGAIAGPRVVQRLRSQMGQDEWDHRLDEPLLMSEALEK